VIIIDVREPDELVNEGVIPGATNIPMGQVESALRMSPAEFEATYGRPQPQREDPIIFICRVGRRAADMGNHVRYLYSELFINDVTQSHILIRPSLTFLCTLKKINDTISLFRFYFAGLLFALL